MGERQRGYSRILEKRDALSRGCRRTVVDVVVVAPGVADVRTWAAYTAWAAPGEGMAVLEGVQPCMRGGTVAGTTAFGGLV